MDKETLKNEFDKWLDNNYTAVGDGTYSKLKLGYIKQHNDVYIEFLEQSMLSPKPKESDVVKNKEMVNFVLEIDLLSTKEFCDKYKAPTPYFTGDVESSALMFIRVDAIKWQMIRERAKALKKLGSTAKSAEEFIESKELKLPSNDMFSGYKIPYAYLITLLNDFASQSKQPHQVEIEELHKANAELRSLKQSIFESSLRKFFPEREMSFHDKVVFAIANISEKVN